MPPSTNLSTRSGSDAVYLTEDDVGRLLHEDSADARINVLDKISVHYANRAFNPREFEYAEQIFRLLMKDAELRVRQRLAEQVKDNPDVPRDVILHLAEDVEYVAIPVLKASDVLSDADLIRIIETSREISKLVAITARNRVSSRLSQALVDTNYPNVITSLLQNERADISEKTFGQIIQNFLHDDNVAEAMVERARLPVSVAEKLIQHVSGTLAGILQERFGLEAEKFERQTREHVTLDFVSRRTPDEEIEQMIDHMIAEARLTPSIILSSLCRGQLRFFETALARMARIPVHNAQKLVHDKGNLGFHALYMKTSMPESMFDAVRILLQVVISLDGERPHLSASNYANKTVQQLLERTRDMDIENIPYIIALIRQSANG
jgi:uncharacterized protein (DUF2336 family)